MANVKRFIEELEERGITGEFAEECVDAINFGLVSTVDEYLHLSGEPT